MLPATVRRFSAFRVDQPSEYWRSITKTNGRARDLNLGLTVPNPETFRPETAVSGMFDSRFEWLGREASRFEPFFRPIRPLSTTSRRVWDRGGWLLIRRWLALLLPFTQTGTAGRLEDVIIWR